MLRLLLPSALILSALLSPAVAHAAPGSLIIVGGALSPANEAIHKAFLARRPAGAPGIAIIPAASGSPADSAAFFAETLTRHGARREDIRIVHLATEDDPTTPGIDESRWAGNATSPAEIAKLADAGAIWFTGGDQLRTTRLLLTAGGFDTPMLAAIRARLSRGAIIGGTSAGAAIMSGAMITNGESMPALTQPVLRQGDEDTRQEGGQLVLGQGLGFFPVSLVDQHFDARARLGRLARALFTLPADQRLGFGIDENTALLVDLARQEAHALGASSITILDARNATQMRGDRFGASGITLSVATAGDRVDLATLAIAHDPIRKPIEPRASPSLAQGNAGGMAVPSQPLGDLLADELISRPGKSALERLSFSAGKSGLDAIIFGFGKTADTSGFAGRDRDGAWRTTIKMLELGIRPVSIDIKETAE